MRTVLIVIAIIVIGGLGLRWFTISSHNDNGEANVTVSVDKDKIEADKDKMVDKVQDVGHKAAEKIGATTQKARD